MDDWEKSWLSDESPLGHICGCQYIHRMVVLNLIPFSRTPIMILQLFVMLVGAMKWRMQNKRRAM